MAIWTILAACSDCGAISPTLDSVILEVRPSLFGRAISPRTNPSPNPKLMNEREGGKQDEPPPTIRTYVGVRGSVVHVGRPALHVPLGGWAHSLLPLESLFYGPRGLKS